MLTFGFIPQHAQAHRFTLTAPEPGIRLATSKPIASLELKKTPTFELLELAQPPYAATGTYANTYEWGNCTWYVAGRKPVPQTWGNANTWAARAAASGYTVSNTPIAGAIAQSTGGYFGHVAIVEQVSGGQVKVTEMNVGGLGVIDEAWYPTSHFNNYIYF